MKKRIGIILFSVILMLTACSTSYTDIGSVDLQNQEWTKDGEDVPTCIPDAETAIKIAEIYLRAVFSKELVESQKPFNVSYDEKLGIWIVYGQTHTVGGDIYIALNEKDGKVLRLTIEE
ncbi:MAG: NTF2 fold immunity protein [Bacillota bacterium]